MDIVKCCATCKRIQPDTNYCHRRKETRYNVLGDVECDYYAKRWREGWKGNVVLISKITEHTEKKYYDALSWTGA